MRIDIILMHCMRETLGSISLFNGLELIQTTSLPVSGNLGEDVLRCMQCKFELWRKSILHENSRFIAYSTMGEYESSYREDYDTHYRPRLTNMYRIEPIEAQTAAMKHYQSCALRSAFIWPIVKKQIKNMTNAQNDPFAKDLSRSSSFKTGNVMFFLLD